MKPRWKTLDEFQDMSSMPVPFWLSQAPPDPTSTAPVHSPRRTRSLWLTVRFFILDLLDGKATK